MPRYRSTYLGTMYHSSIMGPTQGPAHGPRHPACWTTVAGEAPQAKSVYSNKAESTCAVCTIVLQGSGAQLSVPRWFIPCCAIRPLQPITNTTTLSTMCRCPGGPAVSDSTARFSEAKRRQRLSHVVELSSCQAVEPAKPEPGLGSPMQSRCNCRRLTGGDTAIPPLASTHRGRFVSFGTMLRRNSFSSATQNPLPIV